MLQDPGESLLTQSQTRRQEWALELRRTLGVPEDAARVMVFAETSHWDPNWLYTSEQYYEKRIRPVMDDVVRVLKADTRRVFSVECIFFLRLYWDRNPEQQAALHELVNRGQLRLSGSGITTPDVVLPETEAILRDYQLGQEWLRARDLRAEPSLAYLPDDFGYTPALPGILRALGMDMAGITRIDGMYFVGSDYRPKRAFPLAGSSAELLTREHQTLDFVWQGPDGSQVLTHWNAFTYFQGDLLGYLGIIRWMGRVYGFALRNEGHVARQINRFARTLAPLARTPYLFCPIGCDFNGPIPGLLEMLDRYNRKRYPDTGTWVVNAGLDDYLHLVAAHLESLPVLEFDPNPYWMGFYASRPLAKRLCNRISRKLVLSERLRSHAEIGNAAAEPESPDDAVIASEALAEAWDLLAISNHHDFITGTSPEKVWLAEQRPWLERADQLSDDLLKQVHGRLEIPGRRGPQTAPIWSLTSGRLEILTQHVRLVLDEAAGGCITSFKRLPDGPELLAGPGNDLVLYRESGGLWRMGHEYSGGTFREVARSSEGRAEIRAELRDNVLEVAVESTLARRPFVRTLYIRNGEPALRLAIDGSTGRRRTVVCEFPTSLSPDGITMDVPGGVVERPATRLYSPTFWPARSFAHIRDTAADHGLALFLGGPVAPSLQPDGRLQFIALRNAPREMAWGVVPLLSHPATGWTDEATRITYGLWHTPAGDWLSLGLHKRAHAVLHRSWNRPDMPDLDALADELLTLSHEQVSVLAFKRADRGSGYIVRLAAYGPPGGPTTLGLRDCPIAAAWLCDARERDIRPLQVAHGKALVPLESALCSVRILP